MVLPMPGLRGLPLPGFPQAAGWAGVGNPWRLAFVPAESDPSAGEYGLLDPRLAEEPELPGEGLLSPTNLQQAQIAAEDLPIPAVKPMPPFRLSDVEREGMIDRLIRREGQYVNHPSDRGGPTNYGVTQIAIDDYNSLMGMEGGA
jgi:hypothetical protein